MCILKQDILQKNLQIHRSFFASYGTHTLNYMASLEIFMPQGRRTQRSPRGSNCVRVTAPHDVCLYICLVISFCFVA